MEAEKNTLNKETTFSKVIYYNIIFFLTFISLVCLTFLTYDFLSKKPDKSNKQILKSDFKRINDAIKDKRFLDEYVVSYYPDYGTNVINLNGKIFPINGISNRKTYYCNEQEYLSSYISDRHGFNNPDNVYESKTIDIALIGDSYVQGACTNEYTIRNVLTKISNNQNNIVSFAQGGAGPLLELAYLKEYTKYYKPKHIFWFWVGNDLRNLQDELQSPLLNYIKYDFNQQLILPKNKSIADKNVMSYFQLIQPESDSASLINSKKATNKEKLKMFIKLNFPKSISLARTIQSKISNYQVINKKNKVITREEILTRTLPKKELDLMKIATKQVMKEVKTESDKWGADVTLIYLGFGGFNSKPYIDKKKYDYSNQLQRKLLKEIAKENEFSFYDLDKDIDSTFSANDHINGHFSDSGYQRVGKLIFDSLKNKFK